MKKVEIMVFNFDELGHKAKAKAREDFRAKCRYPFFDDNMASLKAFVEHLGGRILKHSIGDLQNSFVTTTIEPKDLFHAKKTDFKRDYMPTGYIADSYLWEAFYDNFTYGGYHAYLHAIDSFLEFVALDVEDYFSNDSIDDTLMVNEYDFLADGSVFTHKFRKVA